MVRTFQETTIFKNMTVRDNVIIAHHLLLQGELFRLLPWYLKLKPVRMKRILVTRRMKILAFLGLDRIAGEIAKNLPHGHLRALGIAIGLATNPAILLLDEPFAGMNYDETMKAVTMVRKTP